MAKRVDRRVEIIRTAAREFQKLGYDGTSIDHIAQRAGVTKPGIYYHFDSKGELLFAVVSRAMDFLENEIDEVTATSGDSEDVLRQILYRNALLITKEWDGAFTLLVIDLPRELSAEHRSVITRRKRRYFDTVRTLLADLQKQGVVGSVDTTISAFSLLGMVLWISKWFQAGGRLSPEEVASQVTELALSAVKGDGGTSTAPVLAEASSDSGS